jgi:hypothetical protein
MSRELRRILNKAKMDMGYMTSLPHEDFARLLLDSYEEEKRTVRNLSDENYELRKELRTATRAERVYVKAEICTACKGKGSFYTKDNYVCSHCPTEWCCGPGDNPTCNLLWGVCSTCHGKGMINAPDSPVIAKDPLAPYRH